MPQSHGEQIDREVESVLGRESPSRGFYSAYDTLSSEFQQKFGKPLHVTGDSTNNPKHNRAALQGFAFDVRTKDLTPEQQKFISERSQQLGLKSLTARGGEAWASGPHVHLQRGSQVDAEVQSILGPDSTATDQNQAQTGFPWRDGKSGQGAASLVSTAKPAARGEDNTRLTAAEPFDPLPPMKEGEFREMARASGKQALHSTAPEKRGFVKSFVGSFIPTDLESLKHHLLTMGNPVAQVAEIGEAQFAQVKRAYDNWEAHGGGENDIFKPDVMFPMLAGMTPIFGPLAARAYDQYQSGDTAGALGTASAMGAMALLPKMFKGAKGLRGKGRTAPAEMAPVPEAKPSSIEQPALTELPKTPEIEQGVAALEDRGAKIKTRATGPKEAITETDTETNVVTVNTSKLKGSPEHQARQVEEGVRHEAGHVDLAQDTPAVRSSFLMWLKNQVDAGEMSLETAGRHLREVEGGGTKKWQDAHPDVAERFVEATTKTGTKYEAPQDLPPVPEFAASSEPADQATLASKGKSNVPEWVRSNLDTLTAGAEKSGLADQIEELAAQRLTARRIADRLNINTPEGRSLIRAVRTNRGIPSLEAGEQATDFEQWLANRQKSPSPEQTGFTPLPDAPASRTVPASPDDVTLTTSESLKARFTHPGPNIASKQAPLTEPGGQSYFKRQGQWYFSNGGTEYYRATDPQFATKIEKWAAGQSELPPVPEGSGYGAGAMKVGQPANASEMAQLSESIAAQEKGKKAPLLRDLGEKAKATGQRISERATAAGDYLKRAFEGLRNPLKITDVDRAVGVLGREHQVSAIEVNDFTAAVRKAVPDALRREAVYNYAVAQGDQALLQKWAGASKGRIRKGYELAQTLTDAEKTVADNFKGIFEPLYQEAFHAGVLNSFIDDYVRQWVKKAPKGAALDKNLARAKAQIDMRLLDPNFKAARQRIFLNPFEGEQAGYEYHKDFAKVLADYYVGMKRAIASRKFIGDMQAATASDNRPVTAVAGSGRVITSPTGATDAYIVRPKVKSEMTSDYLPVEHPAFKGWKWVQESEEGTPIYMQGEMLVHPEYAKRLRNMFQASGVRNYEIAGLKPFGGLLRVQQELKSSLFAGGFFHHVVEGTHAFGHRVNPFTNLPELKGSDPVLLRGMEAGLQVADFHGQEMFADGLAGPGSLFNKFILDPVTAGRATDYQQWLFGSYIPRLKYKTYLHMLERNTGRFGKSLGTDQIELLSARQANAAFGELNYLQMARSKTAQDLSRLFFTAPDFLEARGRFVGQALAPYGAEQRWAIGTLALTQYMTARVFNKAVDNDYHWDRPFSLIARGREYSFRSVPGDLEHLREDWRGFLSYRLNPFTVGLGSELALGRDPQGRYETAGGAVAGALKRAVPIPLQGVVKGTDESLIQSALKVVGVENWKYRTPDERVALERLKETSPKRDLPPDEQKRADLRRRLESEIQHGADPEAVIRQHDKELSPGDKIDLRKANKQKGGEGAAYVLLANNDLDGFEAAFKAATPERQREVYQPLLRRKLAELSGQGRAGAAAKYRLTIDERKRMISRIQQMLGQGKPPQTGQFSPVPQ